MTTTYGDLSQQLLLKTGHEIESHSPQMNVILEELGRQSFAESGVILTSLVVRRNDSNPGQGLMELALALKCIQHRSEFVQWWPQEVRCTFQYFCT